MALGFCVGGAGVGKCGNNDSTISTNITNTAVAEAIYKAVFNCKQENVAGNVINADGECTCDELGYGNSYDCRKEKEAKLNKQAEVCQSILKGSYDLSSDQIVCMCNMQGGACVSGVTQTNIMNNQFSCENQNSSLNKIKNDFATGLSSAMKSIMSDIGGLFDSTDQKVTADVANKISNSFNQQMINDIQSSVNTRNEVNAGCGAVVTGLTQHSQYSAIIKTVTKNSAVNDAMNELSTQVKTSVERINNGFLGWLSSTGGIIFLVIIGVAVLAGIYLLAKYKPWEKSKSKSA